MFWDTGLGHECPHSANSLGSPGQDPCPLWVFASSPVQLRRWSLSSPIKLQVLLFSRVRSNLQKSRGSAKRRERVPG